ncbi:33587_t:CDS:2, partial [Racocetra persica]
MEEDSVEIQIEDNKGPPAIHEKGQIKESALFTKNAAISQDESFLVIFDSIDENYKNVTIRMYNVNIDEAGNKDLSNPFEPLKLTLNFTDEHEEQSRLMESSYFSGWSIAESNESNEYHESFRLLALSCISDNDMLDMPEAKKKSRRGYTKVWMIGKDFKAKECSSIEINDGGIIQFISGADDFTLILLKGNGIYKHGLQYLSNDMKFYHKVLPLNYPERITHALKYNCGEYVSRYVTVPPSDIVRKYLLRCLNRHYLLVDTSDRDPNKNIEIYDLETHQLMNVFKRYKLTLSILDREKPGAFTVSNDEKILAYVSGNDLKIYLIENGLELSSLSCKGGMFDVEFMKFVINDEKLLIFKANITAAVWDIFNSVRESIEFIPLEKNIASGLAKHMTRIVIGPRSEKLENLDKLEEKFENKYFTILNIRPFFDENQIAWDKLVLSEHLTRSGLDSNWKELILSNCESNITNARPNAYAIEEDVSLLDLEESELKYYHGTEPWAVHPAEKIIDTNFKVRPSFSRHVIYLDKEKNIRLLIGNNTIQVWRGKKLEFIQIVNDDPDEPEKPHEKFKIIKIKYGVEKVDLLISKEGKNIQIKIEHEDDIIYIVRSAIDALVYLDTQSNSINLAVGGKRIIYNDIVQQTRNIITSNRNESANDSEKCISRILSVISKSDNESNSKNDIKTELKKVKNIIVKHSLSHKKIEQERPLHSWQVPLKEIFPDEESNIDVIMLTLFLEYYSNNAMDNIGWMNVVSEIIPLLYETNLDWYAQEFLYKPCFGNKALDLSSMKFHAVKKSSENSLKVYIPITQLIPRGESLSLKNISDDEIPYIRMVPLINFATNKKALEPMDKTRRMIIKLFLPGKYSSIEKEEYSHFIRLLRMMNADDAFYDNPQWKPFILLNHPSYISLKQAPDADNPSTNIVIAVPDNPFTNIVSAVLATYNWDSIQFNAWDFWPLVIISVIGRFFYIVILANVIISFMSHAFANAKEESRRGVLRFQKDLIFDYAILEGSSFTSKINSFDSQFKDKLRVRYICFLYEPLLSYAWKLQSEEISPKWVETYGFFARKESSDIDE